jgi:aspartyl-tRNA synthetase
VLSRHRQSSAATDGTNNPKIPTGEVELRRGLDVLNVADVLPFPVDDPEAPAK